MRFTKYEKRKAYHWRDYVSGGKYRVHCDFVKNWVTEVHVLDVGAGDGIITFLLGAIGIDNEEAALKIARTIGVHVTLGDAYNLAYADDSFEAVTMIDVIEHFDDPAKALAEARRVAPFLYIATPERQVDKAVRDPFHVQEWTREELVDFMRENHYQLTGEIHHAQEGGTIYARFERLNTGA